jgi:6-phosphogluconolactonase
MTGPSKREVRILPDAAAITRRAAELFVQAAREAVANSDSFSVALSGGSTPKSLYSLLADDAGLRAQLPWGKIHFFFGDERHVPPEHPDSNFRMANETLFSKALVKASRITRIKGEYAETEKAALEYEQALRAYFIIEKGEFPRFDLVLLGMGDEGHTLSLFPGTKALHAPADRIVVRNWIGKLYTERITPGEPGNFSGDSRRQGSGLESGFGRTLRAGAASGAIDSAGARQAALAGGPGRGSTARNRNSRLN